MAAVQGTASSKNKGGIMRWPSKTTAAICGFVLLVVVYVLTAWLPVYHYESSDRGMAGIEVPWKGRHLDAVEAQFEQYKRWKNDPNLTLCRTCKRRWIALNLLWDNLTHRRWRLPYIEPSPKPNWDYWMQMEKDSPQGTTTP